MRELLLLCSKLSEIFSPYFFEIRQCERILSLITKYEREMCREIPGGEIRREIGGKFPFWENLHHFVEKW